MRVLDFFEAVKGSSSIDEMASAFIHLFPSPSAQDDLLQVEVRLALVFSKLNRAALFVPSLNSAPMSNKSSFREMAGNQNLFTTSMVSSGFSPSSSFNMYRNTSMKSGTGMSVDYTIRSVLMILDSNVIRVNHFAHLSTFAVRKVTMRRRSRNSLQAL
jgi:hypothetical protein